ncbi:MAG: hypothetical protein IJ272_01965 [Clostridia bacterium]|nr:hypothetical protein [Clostridia bacterium]
MRIKKTITSLLVISIIVFLVITVITNSKYVWKMFGYAFCENIDNIQVYSVIRDYNNDSINIKGSAKDVSGFYSGYTFNIQQDTLYIGLKYNNLFGYEALSKDFFIQIPCDLHEVKNVYLVDLTDERKI